MGGKNSKQLSRPSAAAATTSSATPIIQSSNIQQTMQNSTNQVPSSFKAEATTTSTASVKQSGNTQQTLQNGNNQAPSSSIASHGLSDIILQTLQKRKIMEEKLAPIQATYEFGKHNQAIVDIKTLINHSSTDSLLYMAYDLLGEYLDRTGQHAEAVQAWESGLQVFERHEHGINGLNYLELASWINTAFLIARTINSQGKDGPGVSRQFNRILCTRTDMTESEKTEWKNEHFRKAVKYFKQLLDKLPENLVALKPKFQISLASALFDLKNYDEAEKIYNELFSSDRNPEWLYKVADCLWQQGQKEQANTKLEQVISIKPTFANAHKMRAAYLKEKNDTASAEESTRQHNFSAWIPSFCNNIEYSPENLAIFEALQSDKALECVETILSQDLTKSSTEFLATICYHHHHGAVENRAFEELEKRGISANGPERDFIGSILMYLIKNPGSVCTKKGAASALAGMKYKDIFEVLMDLLLRDIDIFPMNIAMAIAKLGDPRAVPLLVKLIERPIQRVDNDSDSSDDFVDLNRLIVESCLALATFISDDNVKAALLAGINREHTHEACLVALYMCTGNKLFLDSISKILAKGKSLHHAIIWYLKDNADTSKHAATILKLNKEVDM